jgi:hypothetical protein
MLVHGPAASPRENRSVSRQSVFLPPALASPLSMPAAAACPPRNLRHQCTGHRSRPREGLAPRSRSVTAPQPRPHGDRAVPPAARRRRRGRRRGGPADLPGGAVAGGAAGGVRALRHRPPPWCVLLPLSSKKCILPCFLKSG